MSDSLPVKIISPVELTGFGEIGPFPLDLYERKYLAQGDSWFSIGSIPPGLTTNILQELELGRSAVVVNCAFPGAVLRHMADTTRAAAFLRLIVGRLALRWDAILLSGGGNDLIDAIGVHRDAPPHLRLLATPQERGPGPLQPDDYVSLPGWDTFAEHIKAVFAQLVALRDRGVNRGVPLVFHTYSHIQPRRAPAGLGFGPWLAPALEEFAVPESAWLSVATALVDRLVALLQEIVAERRAADPECALHLIDSRAAPLVLAGRGTTGRAGDFENEIHLTRGGYDKVARLWQATVDALPAAGG